MAREFVMGIRLNYYDNDFTSGVRGAQRETENLRGSLDSLGGSVTGVIGKLAGIGAAVGGIGAVVSIANDYQGAMNQIQASTGASVEEMKQMKEVSKNLYNQNLGENWEDLGNQVSLAAQVTQQTGAELERTTRNAIVLGETFEGMDPSVSLKAATNAAKNFGISTDEAYNLFAQGAQKGLNYSDDLLDTTNEYSVYFKKLGFDAEGMFNVFAAGADKGVFMLDKIGDSIKEFGIRSKDGSKATMQAYKDLGLNGAQLTDEFAQGGATAQAAYQKVGEALRAMKDPALQSATAVALFGTQAEDLEIDAILALTSVRDQFDMTVDTMGKLQEIKYDTIGNAFKGIGRQLQTAFIIPLIEAALPALSQFSNWFRMVVPQTKAFFKAMSETKEFQTIMTVGRQAFEVVVQALRNLQAQALIVFAYLKDNWDEIKPYVQGFAIAIGTVITVFTTFRTVAMAAALAARAFGIALALANPITAIIAGLTLLVGWFIKANGGIGGAVEKIKGWFNVLSEAWKAVTWIWQGGGFTGGLLLKSLGISPEVVAVIVMIVGKIRSVFDTLMAKFTEMKTNAVAAWPGIRDTIVNSLQTAWTFIQTYFMPTMRAIGAVVMWVVNQVRSYWPQIQAIMITVFQFVQQTVIPILTDIASSIFSLIMGIVNFIRTHWTAIVQITQIIWASIGPYITGALNGIVAIVRGAFALISSIIRGAWNIIKGIIQVAFGIIQGIFGTALSILQGDWQGAWDSMIAGLKTVWEGIKNFFSGLKTLFWDSGKAIITTLGEGIKAGATAVVDSIKGVFDQVRSYMPFSDAKKGPLSDLTYSGGAIMTTMASGIKSQAGALQGAVSSAFAGASQGFSANAVLNASPGTGSSVPASRVTPVSPSIGSRNGNAGGGSVKIGTLIGQVVLAKGTTEDQANEVISIIHQKLADANNILSGNKGALLDG